MKNNKIFITLKKELRAIVRDKKSLVIILFMPFLIPLMIFFMAFLYDFMIPDEDSEFVIGTNYVLNETEEAIIKELNLEATNYKDEEELKKAYENAEISAYIILKDNTYQIYYNPNDMDSSQGASFITSYLESYNDVLAENNLVSNYMDPNILHNINYEMNELEEDNYLLNLILQIAFPYVIMIIILVATTCATDITAGEKERGTLETMLTFPIKNEEIVFGKFLAIFLVSFISGLFGISMAWLSIKISCHIFTLFEDIVFNVTLMKILMSILIIAATALIVSGMAIAIASRAKTFKEAQSSLQPLSFLALITMFLPMLGIKTNALISLIPLVNQGMLLNDLFNAEINYLNIGIMFASSVIFIILIIYFIAKQYRNEKILFS